MRQAHYSPHTPATKPDESNLTEILRKMTFSETGFPILFTVEGLSKVHAKTKTNNAYHIYRQERRGETTRCGEISASIGKPGVGFAIFGVEVCVSVMQQ